MKKLTLGLVLTLFAGSAFAQAPTERVVLRDYDLDGTSTIYACLGDPIQGPANIKNASSLATIVSASSVITFSNLSVGDVLQIIVNGTTSYRTVTAKNAAQTQITVDSAIDLSANGTAGYRYQYQKFTSGTSDDTCWLNVGGYAYKTFIVQYEQGDYTGGVDFDVECKGNTDAAKPVRVYPSGSDNCGGGAVITPDSGFCNIATANAGTIEARFAYGNFFYNYGWCRVGLKGKTADSSDSGANVEKVTVLFSQSAVSK